MEPAAPSTHELYNVENMQGHTHPCSFPLSLSLSFSLFLSHTHTHTHTLSLCVSVWWGAMINSDLQPDIGVVGVGGVKGERITVRQPCVNCSAIILTSRPTRDSQKMTRVRELKVLCLHRHVAHMNTHLFFVCFGQKRTGKSAYKCSMRGSEGLDGGIQRTRVVLIARQSQRRSRPPYVTRLMMGMNNTAFKAPHSHLALACA